MNATTWIANKKITNCASSTHDKQSVVIYLKNKK